MACCLLINIVPCMIFMTMSIPQLDIIYLIFAFSMLTLYVLITFNKRHKKKKKKTNNA